MKISRLFFALLLSLNERVMFDPECKLFSLQNALKEFVSSADTSYGKKYEEFFVGFDGRYQLSSNG